MMVQAMDAFGTYYLIGVLWLSILVAMRYIEFHGILHLSALAIGVLICAFFWPLLFFALLRALIENRDARWHPFLNPLGRGD